jgi:hypothetical protein
MPKSHAAKASRIFAAMQLRRSKTGGYAPAGAADLAVKSR